jgi:hypothetical protein
MTTPDLSGPFTRRRALTLAGVAGGMAVAGRVPAEAATCRPRSALSVRGHLPADRIQQIVGAEGTVSQRVLQISIARDDIGRVNGPEGVRFDSDFQIHGDLTFQPLGSGRAFLNADLALKASELNRVIDALDASGLVFQAEHQHYVDLSPQVWFIHFRGLGRPLDLARAARKVIDVTAAKLPQKMPSKPTTPLDHKRLVRILGGSAEVGGGGVVTVTVGRTDRIVIDGVHASPEANISTNIEFKPLDSAGRQAAVGPDFSMRGPEVRPTVRAMRANGFQVGCLYNQETDEHPQLYFSHMLAKGDPYVLAAAVRRGLDHTKAERPS